VIQSLIQPRTKKVDAHARPNAPVTHLCRLLGVSRSGVYAAQARERQRRPVCRLGIAVRTAFEDSARTYGSRRICAALRSQGVQAGRHRVRRLMREQALTARWQRKFVHTTDSRHNLPVAQNVLNREFSPSAPNRAWACDITYVRTDTGWLYLAAVLDLYSRKVIGWACAPNMPAELVCSALQMAIDRRQPAPGLIVHSDRGSQYASLPAALRVAPENAPVRLESLTTERSMTHVNIPALANIARPVVEIHDGQATTISTEVARVFGKGWLT